MARRVLHDEYFRKAKAEGYLARSAYKLKQMQESRHLLRRGDHMLDLGCAPGAWLRVGAEIVGPGGRVVGVDLQHVSHRFGDPVEVIQGDVFELEPHDLMGTSGNPFDAVLSDMAPKTTGHNEHELSVRLCHRVLELAPSVLKLGGNLAMKVFEGSEYRDLLDTTSHWFAQVKGYKPKASRSVSREMYVVAKGFAPE